MRRVYLIILVMLISNNSIGQNNKLTGKELVKKVIIGSFDDIWSNLDSIKIKKYHTDDFLLLEHGEVWTNATIKNYQKKALQASEIPKRINRFEFIEVKISGNTAWLAYHNYATFSIENKVVGNAHWLESATAIKTKSGWKLQMLHSTRINNK